MKTTGVALGLLLLSGCSSEVILSPEGTENPIDGPTPAPAPAPDPACTDSEEALVVDVRNAVSGSFVGDALHLYAEVDGEKRYVVLALSAKGAWVAAKPDGLDGPAALVTLRDGLSARLRATELGTVADVIDTSDPFAPALSSSIELGGTVGSPWLETYTASDEQLLFCMEEPASGLDERYLHVLDLRDPLAPYLHGAAGGFCDRNPSDGVAAGGSVWMVWGADADAEVHQVSPQGGVKVGDYYYAPDGIHQYGAVRHAATDGRLAVFDAENEKEFFLFDLPSGGGMAQFNHAVLAVSGPKRLLDVRGGLIYLATPAGVRAYAVGDFDLPGEWANVTLLDYAAEIPFGDALAHPIAGNDAALLVADAAGTLYLVPRNRSGPVAPLTVYDREPAEPCP